MPRRRFPSSRLLIALGLLVMSGLAAAQPGARPAPSRDRSILMLDYGDPNRPAFVPFNSAFLAALRADSTVRTIVYREQHDPRVATDTSFDATALAIWGRRYAAIPLDVIVANGPIELQLAVRLRERLAREIPIVYRVSASVPSPEIGRFAAIPDATGIVDAPLVAPVVADLLRLRPTLRHLLLIVQNENDVTFVQREADTLLTRVTLHPWAAPSITALRDSVRRLRPDAAVLYVSVFLDADGRIWTPADYLAAFAPVAVRPVFGLYRNLIGHGTVGGPVIDPARQGAMMAARTLAVLREPMVAMRRFIDTLPGWTPTYAWRELDRHGISPRVLPPGAIVLERPIPIWEGHPVAFWTVSLLLALQTLSIIMLATNRRTIRLATHRQRALTRRMQQAQEEEQSRLARELHDTLGQDLLGQALDLERYAPTAAAPHQATFAERLRSSVTRVEGIARELHPSALQLIDLRASIQQLASDLRHRTGIEVTVSEHGLDRPLPDALRATVFRVIQEALTNVRRHAQAANVVVMLDARGDQLEVTIRDDGIGFDATRTVDPRLGLLGMQERAAAIHGRLRVSSAPNDGTTVTLTVPLPAMA